MGISRRTFIVNGAVALPALAGMAEASFSKADASGIALQEGLFPVVRYLAWDHSVWEASLQDIRPSATILGLPVAVTMPMWQHRRVSPEPVSFEHYGYSSDRIGTLSATGARMTTVIRSHPNVQDGTISFTFAQLRDGATISENETDALHFLGPDHAPWMLTIPATPLDTATRQPLFQITRRA